MAAAPAGPLLSSAPNQRIALDPASKSLLQARFSFVPPPGLPVLAIARRAAETFLPALPLRAGLVVNVPLAIALCLSLAPTFAQGQPPPVDTSGSKWVDYGGDARYQLDIRRVAGQARTGESADYVRVSSTNGSYIFVGQDIGQATLIDELQPSIWVKSDRQGMQLLARVVLPRTIDPARRAPVTTLLRGSQYGKQGQWEQLQLTDGARQLARMVPVLQSQLGPNVTVDARGAYLDQVLVNVYGGQGVTQVWLDGLELPGLVRRTAPEPLAAGAAADAGLTSRPKAALHGAVLTIDGQPHLIKAVTHRGESLAMLKQLGFDAAVVESIPSPEILKEAASADLWLIAPPPSGAIGPEFDRVLAWNMGQGGRATDARALAESAPQLRAADRAVNRPLWCQPAEELERFSRHADLVCSRMMPLSTSIELNDYREWLRQRPRLARPGAALWATVQTEVPGELADDARSRDQPGGLRPATPAQIQLAAFTALSAGARGMVFESHSRLDAGDAATQTRARALELVNLELSLAAPFAAGGSYVTSVVASDANITGALLVTNRARLLVPTWTGPGGQYVPGQTGGEDISLTVPGIPESTDVYELSPAGLRPVKHARVAGGLRVTLRDFGLSSLVLFTNDPGTTALCRRKAREVERRGATLARELAVWEYGQVETVGNRLAATQAVPPQGTARLAAARASLESCDRTLARGDWGTAYLEARRATRPLRSLERIYWSDAVQALGAPLASPYSAQFGSLVEHWELLGMLKRSRLSSNRVTGGDFEDFALLPQAGWKNNQYATPGVAQAAEVSDDAHSGRSALRLAARASDPRAPAVLDTPPIWITSNLVSVEAGRWYRIRGWVNVRRPITGSIEGLLIYDSLHGQAMGMRFGKTEGWREFTMYRKAPRSADLFLTILLSGLGEATVDDVSVELLEP